MSEELTKEDAYKILELDPSTPRRRVKLRYENLMRDAKFNNSVDTILITEAFDIIMEVEWAGYDPSVYSEKGLNKKKISNFIYHYKWMVLSVTVISIILLITTLLYIFDYKDPDYWITIVGGSGISNADLAFDHYTELLGVDDVQLDVFTVGEYSDGEIGVAGMEWVIKDMASGDSDIYLLSSEFSKFLSYEGAVHDLTPLLEKAGVPLNDENIVWWYNEDGNEIASAYRFGTSEILTECVSGFMPDCFIIPFRAEITELTEVMIGDLIHNIDN